MTPAERDARLVLQGVLLALASIFGVSLAGSMLARAQGYLAVSAATLVLLAGVTTFALAGAWLWAVPEQRRTLRWTLHSLVGLLLLAAAGSLLVWCIR